jgi:hypothetical protein
MPRVGYLCPCNLNLSYFLAKERLFWLANLLCPG